MQPLIRLENRLHSVHHSAGGPHSVAERMVKSIREDDSGHPGLDAERRVFARNGENSRAIVFAVHSSLFSRNRRSVDIKIISAAICSVNESREKRSRKPICEQHLHRRRMARRIAA
ncbi:MAG: hypothetical protein F4Y00_01690 [Bacteroidetes bacterium SB0662_bin_6]|nr:hypothetical protein [Bacteroidetes bacterium SB0668_bin_1]MYE03676.1 hypothetical protein [Bacteroidetes bacterium SB0662_bin_6]